MIRLTAKIRIVDMNGYCGRDNHPEATDSGQIVEVVNMQLQRFDAAPVDDVDIVTARMADGRIVDLIEHEVEWIKADTRGATVSVLGPDWTPEAIAERAKKAIRADIVSGQVPPTVKSFSELHDYVDANCYADLADDFPLDVGDQADADIVNAAFDILDAWIKAGRP